jgi:hypothetical protein
MRLHHVLQFVAAAFEEHDACASGWRSDTSPPDGLLLVNRRGVSVYESQLTLNQCFDQDANRLQFERLQE